MKCACVAAQPAVSPAQVPPDPSGDPLQNPTQSPMQVPTDAPSSDTQQSGHRGHGVFGQLPDLSDKTPEQLLEAQTLRDQTFAATRGFTDINQALAAGYLLRDKSLAKVAEGAKVVHVPNPAYREDGRILDPTRPEHLLYRVQGDGSLALAGAMFTVPKDQYAPSVGGGIGVFHRHSGGGTHVSTGVEPGGMMHVWFVDDLATAYRQKAPRADRVTWLG